MAVEFDQLFLYGPLGLGTLSCSYDIEFIDDQDSPLGSCQYPHSPRVAVSLRYYFTSHYDSRTTLICRRLWTSPERCDPELYSCGAPLYCPPLPPNWPYLHHEVETRFEIGGRPAAMAAGDLNGDGAQDVVATTVGSRFPEFPPAISILFGGHDGTFEAQRQIEVGDIPTAVEISDLNGDGANDIVFGDRNRDDITVLLGRGDGTFGTERRFRVGNNPWSIAIGDFDSDNTDDIVTANLGNHNVSVLFGIGDGTFEAARNIWTGYSGSGGAPASVKIADLNGDGANDIVTANSGSNDVSSIRNYSGDFSAEFSFRVGDTPVCVAVADLNHDSIMDLATANSGSNDVSVLIGLGHGVFNSEMRVEVGDKPTYVEIADINRDGDSDIVTINSRSHNVSLLLGNGDGTFEVERRFETGYYPVSAAITDLNGDEALDLAIANSEISNGLGFGDISVLLGSDNGVFMPEKTTCERSSIRDIVQGPSSGLPSWIERELSYTENYDTILEMFKETLSEEVRESNRLYAEELLGLRVSEQVIGELEGTSEFRQAVDRLTAAKEGLKAFVSLAFPRSMVANEYMRCLLCGDEALYDRDVLVREATSGVNLVAQSVECEKRTKALQELINTLLAEEIREPWGLVEGTLLRLQNAKFLVEDGSFPVPDFVLTVEQPQAVASFNEDNVAVYEASLARVAMEQRFLWEEARFTNRSPYELCSVVRSAHLFIDTNGSRSLDPGDTEIAVGTVSDDDGSRVAFEDIGYVLEAPTTKVFLAIDVRDGITADVKLGLERVDMVGLVTGRRASIEASPCEGYSVSVGLAAFRRADANRDGRVDLSDAVSTLGSLFLGMGEIACEDAADSNDDGIVDISDVIHTLAVLYLGQGTISAPGSGVCGPDPTADSLGCVSFPPCQR